MFVLVSSLALAAAPPPVVNGEITKDYPEVVLLYMLDSSGMAAGCTGELIAPRWVLTASHCVYDTPDFKIKQVYVSWVNNSNEMDSSNSELAKEWYPNPDYTGNDTYHDIALVELRSDHEGPFMPLTDRGLTKKDEGELFRLVGFGITSDNDTSQVSKKRTAEIPLDSYDSRLMYTLDEDTDKNACHGDSGGPFLRQYEDGTYAVAGIVDFGGDFQTGSCLKGGVYSARVDAYMSFIDGYTTDYTIHTDAPPEDTGTEDTAVDTGSGEADTGGDTAGETPQIIPGVCSVADPRVAGLGLLAAGLLASGRRRRLA